MATYRFDEIAINSTKKKKPTEEDKVHYIGLEHIDPGCFNIVRWGSDVAPTGDKLLMQKGDVLFGKRRAYQRKVGIAPFDGIFSAHGMVLRPNTEIIDANYFPFFISSDRFMETAVRISVGGLSPTINWKDLAKQKFDLPTLEEQKVLADKLWAAYRLKEGYKKLLAATDEMVKSQFIEMFGDCVNRIKLSSLCSTFVDGDWIESKDQSELGIRLIQTGNVGNGFFKDKEDKSRYISEETFDNLHCTEIYPGDILVSRLPDPIGRACIIPQGLGRTITAVDCTIIRLKDIILPDYFIAYTMTPSYVAQINEVTTGTTRRRVSRANLGNILIPCPSIAKQQQFVAIAKQADKSKFGDFKSQFIEMYHKTHNTQTLESVCAIISKGITPKYVDFSSVAVVNQACIQWDGQHLENIKYHNEEILFKKRTLQTGDVLLNATGTGTLGRCCVFNCPSNDNIYINDGHVIALATDKSILLPEVLNAYLSLNDTQAEIYRLYVTGSTNQVDIVFSDIKKMKVPVPNIDDQISFVRILNQADKSKSYVRIVLKNLESMLGYYKASSLVK